ncbi:MAG: hypothetical protein H6Q68_1648 [Firmicutes bacterium]|nr:hypothetical protein [Bacillota bacterium]
MYSYPTNAELAEMVRLLSKARMEHWIGEDFGTWRWWILLLLLIIPWFIWYKYADKKQFHELTLFGLFIMISSITLDELGFELSLWNYPVDVIPLFPRLTSVDYTAVPVIHMLVYQYFSTWKSFFWAMVVKATVFSFILEPLIVQLGFYKMIKWNHLYSFPIYIVVGLCVRWIVKKIFAIAKRG